MHLVNLALKKATKAGHQGWPWILAQITSYYDYDIEDSESLSISSEK